VVPDRTNASGADTGVVAETARFGLSSESAARLASGRQAFWASAARVGVQVAGALEYAHRQGVLHRDVKPSNLLLDAHGTAWVTDFGLAKAEGQPELTHTGDLLGTLRYMPPEAFEGRYDARSDVYALGLTLFELLALRPAFDERDRNRMVRRVMTGDPPRLRKHRPDAPRDLVTVVEKAIERDPGRRYQSAGTLADDLQRYLDGRPITARRATELQRAWMWALRRPAIAGLVAASVFFLLAGSIVSAVFAVRADGFARDADLREREAKAALGVARTEEAKAVAARDDARQTRNASARQAAELLLDQGVEGARGGEPARALHLFVRALRTLPQDDPESAPLERVIRTNLTAWAETVPALEHILPGGPYGGDAAFSPDGSLIACRVTDDEVRCFRTDTGAAAGPPLKHPKPPFVLESFHGFLAFAPDGKSLWVATAGPNAPDPKSWAIHRFDPLTGKPVQPPIPTDHPVGRLAVTPDGRYLAGMEFTPASASPSNQPGFRPSKAAAVVVWETANGRVVRRHPVRALHWVGHLGMTPDGKTVSAHIVPAKDGGNFVSFPTDGSGSPVETTLPIGYATFRPDVRAGLRHDENGLIHRWSAPGAGEIGPTVGLPFRLPPEGVHSPDGRALVGASDRRLLDTGAWPPRPTGVRFEQPGTKSFQGMYDRFSPDERFIVTGVLEAGKEKWLWRLPRAHSRPPIPSGEMALQPTPAPLPGFAKFDARRERVILRRGAFPEADVRVVDVNTGAIRGLAIRHQDKVYDVAFRADGRYFGTVSIDGLARVWNSATGRPAGPELRHAVQTAALAFHPNGITLVVASYDNQVVLWDWQTRTRVRTLPHDDIVVGLRISPDGRYLAAVKVGEPARSRKEELWLWDLDAGTVLAKLPFERWTDGRDCIEFRPDSRAVCGVDRDGVLRMWELPSGKLLDERPLDGRRATRFTPDSRVLAIAESRGVRLLDAHTLDPLPGGHLPHAAEVQELAFSPDGTLLLAGCDDGSTQLWDVATRKPLGPTAVLLGPSAGVEFTADGRTCLCVAPDGTVRRWPVPVPFAEPDLARLADRVALMTAQRMDDNGGMEFVPAAEWNALRARLVGDGSTALVPPMPEADWHDAVAADAEQDGDTYGALWHLDRLAALRPDDWTVAARRGRVLLRAGRREEAATAYAAAHRLVPSPAALADWLRAAAADDEYRKRTDAAVWDLSRAIELTPGDWTLYLARSKLVDGARAMADEDEATRLRQAQSREGRR
ncbi:MAG TPA: protein kinase, partial [Fimbriiglobus sp.]|nr:protein kinase [Fimbriiglobus sp.]